MKKLSILMFCAVLFASLSSCEESTTATSSDPSFGANPHGGGGTTTNANPEILYTVLESAKGKFYHRIGVCNADGTNGANLVNIGSAANATIHYHGTPCWSGDGSAFAYVESDAARSVSYLKTSAISVVDGKPVASNITTIKTISIASDSAAIGGGVWSPTANEIAYSVQDRSMPYTNRYSEIRVMSSIGGSDQLLYTSELGKSIFWMSYSPDGSKIAFVEWSISSTNTVTANVIKIMDRSTGAIDRVIDTYESGSQSVDIEWSRNGTNKLSYYNSGIGTYIYNLDNSSKTKFATGRYGTWSPNNDRMAYSDGSNNFVVNLSTNVSTQIASNLGRSGLNWKR
jgi:hypothetical protein